jgi:hypothetical protein
MYVSVNIDVDEVLEDLTDEEVQELYDERFSSTPSTGVWPEIYDKRRDLPLAEFIKYLDPIIMDKTGRIIP